LIGRWFLETLVVLFGRVTLSASSRLFRTTHLGFGLSVFVQVNEGDERIVQVKSFSSEESDRKKTRKLLRNLGRTPEPIVSLYLREGGVENSTESTECSSRNRLLP
jgi:hypothetical protein